MKGFDHCFHETGHMDWIATPAAFGAEPAAGRCCGRCWLAGKRAI